MRVIGVTALLLVAAACSDTTATSTSPATSAAATTTSAAPTTPSSAPPTTAGPQPNALGYVFKRIMEDTDAMTVEVTYPRLTHADPAIAGAVNRTLDEWADSLVTSFSEAAIAISEREGPRSTLLVQMAPELVNDSLFSLSGVSFEFQRGSQATTSSRIGWIFDLSNGAQIGAADLMVASDLTRLAEAATAHLISDVFGNEEAITNPAGLDADAANFDAVWLTPTGIGVGFDQNQVANAAAGTPTVLIPFAELLDVLDTTIFLQALTEAATLQTEL